MVAQTLEAARHAEREPRGDVARYADCLVQQLGNVLPAYIAACADPTTNAGLDSLTENSYSIHRRWIRTDAADPEAGSLS